VLHSQQPYVTAPKREWDCKDGLHTDLERLLREERHKPKDGFTLYVRHTGNVLSMVGSMTLWIVRQASDQRALDGFLFELYLSFMLISLLQLLGSDGLNQFG